MQKQLRRPLVSIGVIALAFFLIEIAFERPPQAAPASPTPAEQSRPSVEIQPTEPAKLFVPAMVSHEAESFASYIHFPKGVAPTEESAVQFYCDISADGAVLATYAVLGKAQPFKAAVQAALDWGRFEPAKLNGKPVAVYVGGTVVFVHEDKKPLIVVSLATVDEEQLRKMSNYIQPQLIGGLGERLRHAKASMMEDRPWSGAAEVLVKVTDKGRTESSSVVSEFPKDSGLGDVLRTIVQDGEWIPAYNNGAPTTGQVNIVARFGERDAQ